MAYAGEIRYTKIVGEIYAEGPPVPIPNTEVKLCRAEDTWLATARENRYSPTLRQRLAFPLTSRSFYSSIAQSVEHLTVNQGVTGSSPVGGVHKKPAFIRLRAFLILYITGNIHRGLPMIHIETVLDYQIFQQTDGFADIPVHGTVRFEEKTLENTCNDSCRQRD